MRTMSESDRRREQRIPLRLQVEYATVEEFLFDYTANLSLGGMFIATEHPFDLGTQFRLRFQLPGHQEAVEATAEVVWVDPPEQAGVAGMGVRFSDLKAEDEAAVQTLLDAQV